MLKQRIMTTLVLAPMVLAGVFLLPLNKFGCLTVGVIALGAWEWVTLSDIESFFIKLAYMVVIAFFCWLSLLCPPIVLLSIAVIWWVLAFFLVTKYPTSYSYFKSKNVQLFMGMLTLVPPWFSLYLLKQKGQSEYIAFVLLMVWFADCGAYIVGNFLGATKLIERVSPNKTLEGLYGGLFFGVSFAGLVIVLTDLTVRQAILFLLASVLTVLFSIVGDLLISVLKRERGFKDSGKLLPGHGGVLDRIDSLTSAIPIFTFATMIIMSV